MADKAEEESARSKLAGAASGCPSSWGLPGPDGDDPPEGPSVLSASRRRFACSRSASCCCSSCCCACEAPCQVNAEQCRNNAEQEISLTHLIVDLHSPHCSADGLMHIILQHCAASFLSLQTIWTWALLLNRHMACSHREDDLLMWPRTALSDRLSILRVSLK